MHTTRRIARRKLARWKDEGHKGGGGRIRKQTRERAVHVRAVDAHRCFSSSSSCVVDAHANVTHSSVESLIVSTRMLLYRCEPIASIFPSSSSSFSSVLARIFSRDNHSIQLRLFETKRRKFDAVFKGRIFRAGRITFIPRQVDEFL